MSDIDTIVDVQIDAQTRTPTQQGFGTPLFMAYHTLNTDLVRPYTSLTGMVSDGFTVNDAAYRMAAAAFAQNPAPDKVKIGRMSTSVAWANTLTVTTATAGNVVKVALVSPAGVITSISYTVLGSATTSTVATAVAALIDAIAGVTSSATGAVITVTGDTSGAIWSLSGLQYLTAIDTTGDSNISVDLAAIIAIDSDFYGISISNPSKVNVDEVAAWAESNKFFFAFSTGDDKELSTGTQTIFNALKTAAYERTLPMFSRDTAHYPACAWLGKQLPKDPGSTDWAFKQLAGVAADTLTATQIAALEAQNANYYTNAGGFNITRWGTMASGTFADVILGTDWLAARLKETVYGRLVNSEKINYTTPGLIILETDIKGVLAQAVRQNILAADPAPTVKMPLLENISLADKATRTVPDVEIDGVFAGGVHKVKIKATLTLE